MEKVATSQSYKEAVDKIVNFWVDKSFHTAMNQNNGDDSPSGGMAFILMNMVSDKAQSSVNNDKITLFKEKLTELLLLKQGESPYARTLDVDYHPCRMLFEAAEHAGINPGCFPCKTFTKIDADNNALASYQYGGKLVAL